MKYEKMNNTNSIINELKNNIYLYKPEYNKNLLEFAQKEIPLNLFSKKIGNYYYKMEGYTHNHILSGSFDNKTWFQLENWD